MKKITVVVTNDAEQKRAEYVADHFQTISYSLNGIYFDIKRGSAPVFDAGKGTENDPDYIRLYNAIFKDSEEE
jgi:hypothetical protein